MSVPLWLSSASSGSYLLLSLIAMALGSRPPWAKSPGFFFYVWSDTVLSSLNLGSCFWDSLSRSLASCFLS